MSDATPLDYIYFGTFESFEVRPLLDALWLGRSALSSTWMRLGCPCRLR
jgi:hypothetical protein